MRIALRHSGTMSGKCFPADFICLQNRLIRIRGLEFHPAQQRGTKVKTDLRVIIDPYDDNALFIENSGPGIGGITFGIDARIPIMKGIRRFLIGNGL